MSTGLEDTRLGRKLAEQKLEQMYRDYHEIGNIQDSAVDVGTAYERFLHTQFNKMPRTLQEHDYAFNKIVNKSFTLTADNLEKAVQSFVSTSELSSVTINKILRHFRIFINYCVGRKMIVPLKINNYFLKEPHRENEPFEPDEIKVLIEYFRLHRHRLSEIIEFVAETGARRVDFLTLEWSQVKSDMVIWRNKITKRPEPRPISRRAREILDGLPKIDEKVFGYSYHAGSRLSKKLIKACCDSLIDRRGRSFQNIRVAFRMKLLESGIPKEYIKYLMRHTKETVTDQFYTHHDNKRIQSLLDSCDGYATESEF